MEITPEKCITCLGETEIMHSLTEMYDDCLDLGGLLKICLHCEVNKPYMPKMLCDRCTSDLRGFFTFKLRYLNNEIMMKNKFKQETESDNYKDSLEEIKVEPIEEDIIFEIVATETSEDDNSTSEIKPQDITNEIKMETNLDGEFISDKPTDFKCIICKIFFKDSFMLESHLSKHKNHVCAICGHAFVKRSYLLDHLTTHKDIKDVLCPLCSKAFKSRHTMRVHMRIHTNPGSFICENCGKSFNQRGTLNTHLKLKHSEKRDFLCLWCGMKFNLKASLEKHTLRKHSSLENRTVFKCSKCPMEYLDKSTLHRHFKTKHSDCKPVQCERCHKEFNDKSNLLRHKRTKHSEEIMEMV